MKRPTLTFAALCGIVFSLINIAAAQTTPTAGHAISGVSPVVINARTDKPADAGAGDPANEVESLKRRVEEVERQNRLLIQTVTELKAKLDGANPVVNKATAAAAVTAAQPTTAQATPPTAQADKSAPARWPELISEGNRLKFYGFLRLDLDIDSQHPNNTQTPLFITSPDPAAGGNTNGDFSMHPRLTRLGIDFSGPRIAAWVTPSCRASWRQILRTAARSRAPPTSRRSDAAGSLSQAASV